MSESRQLAAIMFSDIEGYTAMMQINESDGKAKAQHYRAVLEELVAKHGGRVIQNYGDGSLSTFTSAVEAVKCAQAIQAGLTKDPVVPLRIGIHLGDIVVDEGELFGDGINIASRIESMGVAGSVLLSEAVCNEIRNHPDFVFKSLGQFDFKNVSKPLEVFALSNKGLIVPKTTNLKGKFKDKAIDKRLSIPFIIAAIVLVAWGIQHSFFTKESAIASQIGSIAVLPLHNQSNQTEQSYLLSDIHDGLINMLGQLDGLRIISKVSTMRYVDSTEKSHHAIAMELGVDGILSGSILSHNDSLNVDLKLEGTLSNQEPIWSKQYACKVNEIIDVQRDVAIQIANAIDIELTSNQLVWLSNKSEIQKETYKAYLRGMYFINGSTPEDHLKGMSFLHEAVSLDPANPLAYLGLAKGYIALGHGPNPDDEVWGRAKAAAIQAIKLDSTLTEARTVLAILKFYKDWDWDGAEEDFVETLRINPNQAMAQFQYAWLLAVLGRFEEAIFHHILAKELDPLNPLHTSDLGSLYYWSGDLELALKEAKAGLQIAPEFGHGWWVLGNIYLAMNMYDEAIQAHTKASSIHPIWKGALASSYALTGNKAKAVEILEELKQQELSPRLAFWFAHIYMTLGDFDRAFHWLNFKPPDPWVVSVRTWPEFRLMHKDPRFHEFIRDQGLPPILPQASRAEKNRDDERL